MFLSRLYEQITMRGKMSEHVIGLQWPMRCNSAVLWESFYDTMVENPPVTHANGDITSATVHHE